METTTIGATVQPVMASWKLSETSTPNSRRSLSHLIKAGGWRTDRPVIATGHQAWLWHPGILAKHIATRIAADRAGASALNVVVDYDPVEAAAISLPVRRGDRLEIVTRSISGINTEIWPGYHDPIDGRAAAAILRAMAKESDGELLVDVEPTAKAWEEATGQTFAEQISSVLSRLARPWAGEIPLVMASKLPGSPEGGSLVRRMIDDARRCVTAYNRAVALHPRAGIRPLFEGVDEVELPFWTQTRGRRGRLYVDLGDSNRPVAFSDDPEADLAWRNGTPACIVPRALSLTAILRSAFCDLFIHGKGGGVYDRITEDWWRAWGGSELAPMAVASADVRLAFDVPVSDRAALNLAVWHAHHLPHNVDRAPNVSLDPVLVARKRAALHVLNRRDHGRQGRDARAAAFVELHRINDELAARHAELITDAREHVGHTRVGVVNAAVAAKRDWFFGLYPATSLDQLAALMAR